MLDLTIRCKVGSAETNGMLALIECGAPPHYRGPAPQWHARTTQVFYVLDGVLAFALDEKTITMKPGGPIVVPPGMIHAFWNPAAAPTAFLTLCSPGGLERYLEEFAALAAERHGQLADRGELLALAAKYDIRSSGEVYRRFLLTGVTRPR